MKPLKRLILSFVILLILFFVGATLDVRVYGKSLIEEALTNALKRSVVLEKVSYHFPLSLRARNIHIAQSLDGGTFFEAQDIIAQLSFDAIYQRRLIFDSVVFVKPLVVIEKVKKSKYISGERSRRYGVVIPLDNSELATTDSAPASKENLSNSKQTEVLIRQLILKQGRFQYANSSFGKDFSFAVEDVY